MKWILGETRYTEEEKITGEKFGIFIEIAPIGICNFPENNKSLITPEIFFKEDGSCETLRGNIFDKRGNIINTLNFFNILSPLNYPAFISQKDLSKNCPFFKENKEEFLLYNRLDIKVFDNIENTLNIFILGVFNYLKNCLKSIEEGLISVNKKEEFKKCVYSVAHLAKYIKQNKEIQYSIRKIKSIRKLKDTIAELIKYMEDVMFLKDSPYCIGKHTIIYDFSDINFYKKNTIKLTDYKIEIGMEDFLNKTLQNIIEKMLIQQTKSEKEHFEKGRDLLFGLASGDIAPNDFFNKKK